MLELAIAGTFAASLELPIRHHLNIPCNIVVSDEEGIIPLLRDADVLVTMGFTAAEATAKTPAAFRASHPRSAERRSHTGSRQRGRRHT